MGDDIGWMQPSIYHRGLMVGETPNIDRIGREGAMFVDYVAMQRCTSGRNGFFTGLNAAGINYNTLQAMQALKRLKELESLSPLNN
jgi:arylsulfatase A-like enzyme